MCSSTVPGFPSIAETIVSYDADKMELTYTATRGMPWFVASARNTWRVDRQDADTAVVTIAAAVEPKTCLLYTSPSPRDS